MKEIAIALALLSAPALAQESVNETVLAPIKSEAFQRSAVRETLSWLSDVDGPRLTGSPTLRQAGEWGARAADALSPDELKQASAILASFAYHAAMRDAMLPRKPLPKPQPDKT